MSSTAVRQVWIHGIRVDDVTDFEALAIVDVLIGSGRPHYVVTPNPEMVVAAARNPEFARVLNAADLAIPDGGGLLAAARLHGQRLREQVRGTDLAYAMVELAARKGYRVFLLGAGPGVAARAAERLQHRYPDLRLAGTFGGRADAEADADTRAILRQAGRVDILLVAYGAPRQELWMSRNLPELEVGVAMGVGGVLDYMAGTVRRAPPWLCKLGFEWLYRLATQPSRWRRQLALPRFALWTLAEAVRRRQRLT